MRVGGDNGIPVVITMLLQNADTINLEWKITAKKSNNNTAITYYSRTKTRVFER